jgi:hypothetical protein
MKQTVTRKQAEQLALFQAVPRQSVVAQLGGGRAGNKGRCIGLLTSRKLTLKPE